MKPRFEIIRQRRGGDSFPVRDSRSLPTLDCNYQQVTFDRYGGGHAGRSKGSFLAISREYFRSEARWSYLAEIFFFALIMATAGAAVIYGVRVVVHALGLPVSA